MDYQKPFFLFGLHVAIPSQLRFPVLWKTILLRVFITVHFPVVNFPQFVAFPPHLLTCDRSFLPFLCIPGLCFCSVKLPGNSLLWMFSVKASRQLSNCRLHNSQSGPMCLSLGKQNKADARNRSLFYDLKSFLMSTAMLYVTVGQCSLLQRSPELELEKEWCAGDTSPEIWRSQSCYFSGTSCLFTDPDAAMGLQEFQPELCGYMGSIHSVQSSSPHALLLFW